MTTPTEENHQEKEKESITQLAKEFNYSPFMIEQLMKNYPQDYKDVLIAFEQPPLETIRVNTLKITPEALKQKLEKKGFKLRKIPGIDYGYYVDSTGARIALGATHEYLFGYYYLQSMASMLTVHFLYPEPDEFVLDMCAAPGSKTTQIGQFMKNKGKLVAIDINENRTKTLKANLRRCGVENAIVVLNDSTLIQPLFTKTHRPDKILLDAPCSGSGIIKIDKTPKRTKSYEELKDLIKLQKKLLTVGLSILKPGGTLLYSTCSFHYLENEAVVHDVLKKFTDIEIIEPAIDIGMPALEEVEGMEFGIDMLKARRLYPNIHDSDAFFYCLLKKKEKAK